MSENQQGAEQQHEEAIKADAKHIALYYTTLVENGVYQSAAKELVVDYQKAYLQSGRAKSATVVSDLGAFD